MEEKFATITMNVVENNKISFSEMVDAVGLLANTNALYLGIAVTFISILAGAIYLISFKPLERKLQEQEKALITLNEKFEKIITESETELKRLEKKEGISLNELVELFIALEIIPENKAGEARAAIQDEDK